MPMHTYCLFIHFAEMVLIQIKCMLLKSIFSLEYKVEILHNEILIDLFSLLLCLTY